MSMLLASVIWALWAVVKRRVVRSGGGWGIAAWWAKAILMSRVAVMWLSGVETSGLSTFVGSGRSASFMIIGQSRPQWPAGV